jgi:hypothetical protein
MNRIRAAVWGSIGVAACCAGNAAFADNPVGFYLGAGVGDSNLRNDGYGYDNYYGYHDNSTAWKAIAGVRPIAPVGAELEYIDFGRADDNPNYYYGGDYFNGNHSYAKATVLFGVGYLPIPLPFLDVYGKAGVARLQRTTTTYYNTCSDGNNCDTPASGRSDDWSTNFAYGVGVQGKWRSLAVRGEYERISASGNDPDALTVSVTWTF